MFFAVHPDPQAAQRIVELATTLRAKHGLRGKSIPANRVHITLHHLGDHCGLPESLIETASSAAAGIAMPPFQVALDCVGNFPGRGKRPCVLRSGAADANQVLHALQSDLGARLRDAGLGRHVERRFTPHVTLLYDEREVGPEIVQPIAWTVRTFALVHSLLGRGEHRVLAAWNLKA
ncbi:MAG TPA: RNA 2',3'-cyclic phosphodiesterase [Rhodanobacteraceae bacterium]|nr:RNA 2',3'-cyclic phosphodiesterase [Rhodanobacteraceae bacterium]